MADLDRESELSLADLYHLDNPDKPLVIRATKIASEENGFRDYSSAESLTDEPTPRSETPSEGLTAMLEREHRINRIQANEIARLRVENDHMRSLNQRQAAGLDQHGHGPLAEVDPKAPITSRPTQSASSSTVQDTDTPGDRIELQGHVDMPKADALLDVSHLFKSMTDEELGQASILLTNTIHARHAQAATASLPWRNHPRSRSYACTSSTDDSLHQNPADSSLPRSPLLQPRMLTTLTNKIHLPFLKGTTSVPPGARRRVGRPRISASLGPPSQLSIEESTTLPPLQHVEGVRDRALASSGSRNVQHLAQSVRKRGSKMFLSGSDDSKGRDH